MTPATAMGELANGLPLMEAEVPILSLEGFRSEVLRHCAAGARLVALFGRPMAGPEGTRVRLHALLALDEERGLLLCCTELEPEASAYPALTPGLPAAHWFERELAEQFGITPLGHPWLKPLRTHPGASGGPEYPFFTVQGSGVHEVAVGPVHAGVIEPGHFRFQCDGEHVLHLEIQLGYQHRGVEALLRGAPAVRAVTLAESIAGDSCIAHALAHCEAREGLARIEAPLRAQVLRAVALELERLANHLGDLGALAGDVGYLPGASWMGRLRGDVLGMTLALCGNRYGRGFVWPGGVKGDLDAPLSTLLTERLERLDHEFREVADLLFRSGGVLERFEGTGVLDFLAAEALGMVGPAARASGCDRDVRREHPGGFYRFAHLPAVRLTTGDVYARALVRRLDAQHSLAFLRETLRHLPGGPIEAPMAPLPPCSVVASLVEGWRGEVLHVLVTDADGGVDFVKVVDPSFHNWMGLALAMRGGEISDFPLCNKSFNLSYAGHDL